MNSLHVKALSYRVWIDIAAVLFFLPSILYSITYREKAVRRAGRKAYDETDIKRNMYLLSKRI